MTTREEAAAKAMAPVVKLLEATILAQAALAAADAHDLANNVHRVRLDDATVERAAQALLDTPGDYPGEELAMEWAKCMSRAVLAAAVEAKP
jgi:hypothetical protein